MGGLEFLVDAVGEALQKIFSGAPEVVSAVSVSLQVSGAAIVICAILGIPAGLFLATTQFPGRRLLITLIHTLMALPTVVVGLFVYAFLTRRSVLGPLDLLFTRKAMIIGEVVLALPIVIALSHSAIASLDRSVRDTARSLGATRIRVAITMLWEGRFALIAAVTAGFGRVIGEVGVSMILGGNIAAHTRNVTTAIALETSMGEFGDAMALGLVLLSLALGVNFLLRHLQGREEAS
ncbi:MAG: ABC transporter permease [Pseudomonadota bacterium]